MMLRRTYDARFLNEVVNHPEVRPWLGYSRASEIDMTALVSDPRNVALVNEHGGFMFVARAPGMFEVHTQFLPSGRARAAFAAAKQALRYMFHAQRADEITTDVPENNPAALGFALHHGFRIVSERFDHGGVYSGKPQPIFELMLDRDGFRKASAHWRGPTMARESEAAPCL